jgi:hypothetical protein
MRCAAISRCGWRGEIKRCGGRLFTKLARETRTCRPAKPFSHRRGLNSRDYTFAKLSGRSGEKEGIIIIMFSLQLHWTISVRIFSWVLVWRDKMSLWVKCCTYMLLTSVIAFISHVQITVFLEHELAHAWATIVKHSLSAHTTSSWHTMH